MVLKVSFRKALKKLKSKPALDEQSLLSATFLLLVFFKKNIYIHELFPFFVPLLFFFPFFLLFLLLIFFCLFERIEK